MWIILVPQRFDKMELKSVLRFPVEIKTPEEPFMYCPVFESYEAAVAWNGGKAEDIHEIRWKIGAADA